MERKVNIVGVPSEIGAGTRGASLGIEALKVVGWTQHNPLFKHYPIQYVPHENDVLYDESPYRHAHYIDAYTRIAHGISREIEKSLRTYTRNVVLAGDHSTAAATIFALMRAYPGKRLGVVWIDAHADLHSPYTTPSGNMHGMPLALALGEDNLACKRNAPQAETIECWNKLKDLAGGKHILPEDIVFIGLRSFEPEEAFLIERNHIPHISVEDVRRHGAAHTVNQALQYLENCDIVYVSFDVDSMDSAISKGTGTPVANGLTAEEAQEINRLLCENEKVVCWEMVEINPTLDDKGNRMAEVAFGILQTAIQALEKAAAAVLS
ncbi:arginase [Thermonema rossianum]|uniref:arginase n=1 Tax=Thermonema rossianum TaxID=55505 RepID=UPI00056E6B16|nr:arginase [Thermonema rossianum]